MGFIGKLAKAAARKMPKKKTDSKGNTISMFRGQSPKQAQTQKPTEKQRRYRVGQAKGFVAGAGSVLAVGSAVVLYKKDAAFRSRLNAAQKAGRATLTYKGSIYKVPKSKISLPVSKPKTTPSKFKKGSRISYAERFKEIDQEKKAKK